MTEEEARTKWCPFSRVLETGECAHEYHVAFNRLDSCDYAGDLPLTAGVPQTPHLYLGETTLCIASACMAWREKVNGDGFCGLAGLPPS